MNKKSTKAAGLAMAFLMAASSAFLSCPAMAKAGYNDKVIDDPMVFTFDYDYDAGDGAVKLTITSDKDVPEWDGARTHTFGSDTVNDTLVPQKLSNSYSERKGSHTFFEAVCGMINSSGMNLNPYEVIDRIGGLGYVDNGNGIYKSGDAYLTYMKLKDVEDKTNEGTRGGSEAGYAGQDRPPYQHSVTFSSALPDTKYLPAGFTKTEGQAEHIPSREPHVDGYHFDKYTSSLGDFHPGDSYTYNQDGGSINLHANFKSYIKYDNQTGLGTLRSDLVADTTPMDVITNGDAVAVDHRPKVYLIRGGEKVDVSGSVTFVGYCDKADGTGNWYNSCIGYGTMEGVILSYNNEIDISGGDKTLYAQYTINYDLDYDGNGQTSGADFTDHVSDTGHALLTSPNQYAFRDNPSKWTDASGMNEYSCDFKKESARTVHDANTNEDVQYTDKYAFEGWSLDRSAYFKDDRVYMCENARRPGGAVMLASPRDYLSECISFPCDDGNIKVDNGHITITTYAVWDRFPEVWGYDLSYTKESLKQMDARDIYAMMLSDAAPTAYDPEDEAHAALFKDSAGNPYPSVPEVSFANFNKEDFLEASDFGSVNLDLSVTDTAGNTSTYRIAVHSTTDGMNVSKGDVGRQASYFTRYIDEENLSKSYDGYGTSGKALKDLAGLETANGSGALEPYSKWLNDPDDSQLIGSIMSQMDSKGYGGYADSVTLNFNDITNVRRVSDSKDDVKDYVFDGSLDTKQELRDTVSNDSEGYKKAKEINDSKGKTKYTK